MSTLFLIGNGFDINCGMKTQYSDIYKGYINEDSEKVVIKKFKDSISSDYKTWSDFEMGMANYAAQLNNESEFLECIRDFSSYMEKYLIKENDRIKLLLRDERVLKAAKNEIKESFDTFYKDVSHNIDRTMQDRSVTMLKRFEAISFNYTDIFDFLWGNTLESYYVYNTVTHIHGTLQDGPVLGVDNEGQIKSNYEITKKGKRGFIKPIFNTEYDSKRILDAKNKIKNASTICAYGVSFGDSDLSWRNELIEWLKNDKNHHLFLYRYNLSEIKYRTISERIDFEDDAKEQLILEWGIETGNEIVDQIHIPCGKNIFNIETVIKEELEKSKLEKEIKLKKQIEQGKSFVEMKL